MFYNCEEQWTTVTSLTLYPELRKILKFHLISSCRSFVETRKFDLAKIPLKMGISTILPHQEIRWNYGILCSVEKGGKENMCLLVVKEIPNISPKSKMLTCI